MINWNVSTPSADGWVNREYSANLSSFDEITLVGFNLYDVNKDGYITKQEMENMLRTIASMLEINNAIKGKQQYSAKGIDQFIHNFVTTTFYLYNKDNTEGLSFKEFTVAAKQDLQVAQFFTLDVVNSHKFYLA